MENLWFVQAARSQSTRTEAEIKAWTISIVRELQAAAQAIEEESSKRDPVELVEFILHRINWLIPNLGLDNLASLAGQLRAHRAVLAVVDALEQTK